MLRTGDRGRDGLTRHFIRTAIVAGAIVCTDWDLLASVGSNIERVEAVKSREQWTEPKGTPPGIAGQGGWCTRVRSRQ